jgi:hypothetical protein
MRFFGEEFRDIRRLKAGDIHIKNLGDLYYALKESWSIRTTNPDFIQNWIPQNPSVGQSDVTAMLVFDMFGGTIHVIYNDNGCAHYFNKIDGHYIDLASEQFDRDIKYIRYDPNQVIERNELNKNVELKARYKLLKEIILAFLETLD